MLLAGSGHGAMRAIVAHVRQAHPLNGHIPHRAAVRRVVHSWLCQMAERVTDMPAEPHGVPAAGAVDVLVVGAGPTGLVLACDLARRGVRTHVVEAEEHLFGGSRGKSLQPRTLEVLDDLGVMDAIGQASEPFLPMQTWRDGRRQGEWRLIEPDPQAPASRFPVARGLTPAQVVVAQGQRCGQAPAGAAAGQTHRAA